MGGQPSGPLSSSPGDKDSPPKKGATLDRQPAPGRQEKMELMGWVPINQLLIAALSPGPAPGQARTAPPPAPDLSPGDTGTQPWGLRDSDLSWEKCTSSPSAAGVWSGRSSHLPPTRHLLRERLPQLPPCLSHPDAATHTSPTWGPWGSRPSCPRGVHLSYVPRGQGSISPAAL